MNGLLLYGMDGLVSLIIHISLANCLAAGVSHPLVFGPGTYFDDPRNRNDKALTILMTQYVTE